MLLHISAIKSGIFIVSCRWFGRFTAAVDTARSALARPDDDPHDQPQKNIDLHFFKKYLFDGYFKEFKWKG